MHRNRKTYTGESRTTVWRKNKRKQGENDSSDSSDECDRERKVSRLCECEYHQQETLAEVAEEVLPSVSTGDADVTHSTLLQHVSPAPVLHSSWDPDSSASINRAEGCEDVAEEVLPSVSTGDADVTHSTLLQHVSPAPVLHSSWDPDSSASINRAEGCEDITPSCQSLHQTDSSQPAVAFNYSSSDDSDADNWEEDCSSDLECFDAHFLEEEPGGAQVLLPLPPQLEVDGDDLDPDDPEGIQEDTLVESSDSTSIHSDENGDQDLANFQDNDLNIQLVLQNNLQKGEVILSVLGCAVRHSLTFECILDNFRNMNLLFGPNCFPVSKKKLWSVIQLNKIGIQSHVYCGMKECGMYIGRKDRLRNFAECQCGYRVHITKAKFFVTLNFASQLKRFLGLPGVWEKLQYRTIRQKHSPTGIEDVYDGSEYKRMQQDGGPLSSPYNFSYVFNLDGCSLSRKGTLQVWPIFARINELPPELRQKFHFLVAVFIDRGEPNFQSFLRPFVKQANYLSSRGIKWKPDGINEVTSTFSPFCFCVDSPVRHGILNMNKYFSHFGCTYCTHEGVYAGGSMRYPANVQGLQLQPYEDRSHAGMTAAMIDAHQNEIQNQGHKGMTQLLLMRNLDLREGQAVDDLHQDHEGCGADITELLLTTAPRIPHNMTNVGLQYAIDQRLLSIKTPSRLARKPASIKSRASFKGNEWRNWLLFFGVPCLSGLIAVDYLELFSLLSYGCYLLSQDVIEEADIDSSDRLLKRYATLFQLKFGLERTKFNLHVTTSHKVNSVKKLGPQWAYSTYNFESLNRKLVKMITSPKGAIMQVVKRHLLNLTVNSAVYDDRVSDATKVQLQQILSKERLQVVHPAGPSMYLVGVPTNREPTLEEMEVLTREGFHVQNVQEFKSFLKGSTRYKSLAGQDPSSKSDDTFIYTYQDTFCTIKTVILFINDQGEEQYGVFVTEHDVAQVLPVASHIVVLRNNDADLQHYVPLNHVRCPAIKMHIGDVVYAVSVPNCYEID